ncbi:hypothetical protein ABPG74_003121 [Tetrahymena malaccensis]
MKKWEEQQKNKVHQSRIKNVKAAVSNTGVRKSGKLNKSLNDSRQISQIKSPVQQGVAQDNQNSISDYYESEKNNLQSIPLYRILKLQNLQQYARELISRGYGYDLKKFNYLNQNQLDTLLNEIRVQPGHKTKLIDLLDLISNEMIPEIENNSMWNALSPGSQAQNYNQTLQSSGKSMSKANSVKQIPSKQHFQALGKQPATTKNQRQQNIVPNLQRKNSQPHVSTQNRANHHMYYQGNQRQIKSHTSHIKKRTGQNIGYDYFIDSQDDNDGYDEFQEAIESLVNQYNFANNRQIFKENKTDESFKNELQELDLEFELEQNIGYRNQAQMRAKVDKAVSQVNKTYSKTQSNYGSGNSIASNSTSTKNPSLNNSKTNQTSSTISGSSIGQKIVSNNPQMINSKQQASSTTNQTKPQSSQIQKRPNSGTQKAQSISQTQSSRESNDSYHQRTVSNIQMGSAKLSDKDSLKNSKKDSSIISLPTKKQEEEKSKLQQKEKELDFKQKQEIERLKQKSDGGSKTLAQTAKDLASQLQKNDQPQQNQSGIHSKKGRPQTAKYSRNVPYVQDDQCLIVEYDENDQLVLNYKENRLIKSIMKNIKSKNNDNTDELNPQLDYDTIKHMYMSFDGGKLTSTLVNLDIEEMCFCFACAILKHIEHGEETERAFQNNKMYNKLHQIDEEHEDHMSKEQNSSKKMNKQDISMDNSTSLHDTSVQSNANNITSNNIQQQQNNQNQHSMQHQYNDTSLNRTTNPIEEPTMIHDDYNQSIINADAEKYLKDDDQDYRSAERQFPQQMSINNGTFNWKQKKSLSDISERTHEVSHQNNKSITVDQSNEQSLNQRNNLTNANSRKQFEQSRQEMEEILKESLLMNVRDNQSLRRRLEVEHHDDEKEFEYTENEDDEEESNQDMHPNLKRKGFQNIKQDVGNSKVPYDESLNLYLEKNPNSEDEENEFLSQNINKQCQQDKNNKYDLDDTQNQEKSLQEPESFNQDYNQENYEEVESEGEIEADNEQQEIPNNQEAAETDSQLNFSTISRYSMVIPNDDISNKRLFDKTYNYKENSDQIFTQKPTKETIQNYCKNVCISCQLEKQIPIIALVYIERLLNNSGFYMTPKNWRKVTITSMIMASKIWDDESFENKNFSQAFPMFDVIQINEMERVFLNFIDYNLYVKGADYAKYYFILREFAQKNKKSFPLRPLDLKTILYLQNNANRAQSNLKEMYQNPLNKSF